MYEIDMRKVFLVIILPLLAIITAIVVLSISCSCPGGADRWSGEWNREGDSTFSRATVTVYDADRNGFYFSVEIHNGNTVADVEGLRAEFRGSDRNFATYEIADTDAYVEFTLEENTLTIGFISKENMQWDVIEGFSYGANIEGIYAKGEVEYLNTSLSQMGVFTEEEDELISLALTDDQYARLMDCFQMHRTDRNNNDGADVYYGMVTGNEYAAIVLLYDDGTYSMIISEDGTENMSYLTNNGLYTADLGAYPESIQAWIENYQAAYYNSQNS